MRNDQRPEQIDINELIYELDTSMPFPFAGPSTEAMPIEGFNDVFEIEKPLVRPGFKKIVAFLGPSGAGQDTCIDSYTLLNPDIPKIKSATTRPRRVEIDEPEDAYTWMELGPEEMEMDTETIKILLTDRYDLVEIGYFGGSFYGLPRTSLEEAAGRATTNPLVVKSDIEGVGDLRDSIINDFDVIVAAILPESYRQLWDRYENRSEPLKRLIHAARYATSIERLGNYVLRNRVLESNQAGQANITEQFNRFITTLGDERS